MPTSWDADDDADVCVFMFPLMTGWVCLGKRLPLLGASDECAQKISQPETAGPDRFLLNKLTFRHMYNQLHFVSIWPGLFPGGEYAAPPPPPQFVRVHTHVFERQSRVCSNTYVIQLTRSVGIKKKGGPSTAPALSSFTSS